MRLAMPPVRGACLFSSRVVRDRPDAARAPVFALALLATTAAWAQPAYDPTVAYTLVSGKTTSLYLANADGTHAVSVASTTRGFNGIDFAPGGGRIAFSEKGVGIKVLAYTASNSGIAVNGSPQLLAAGSTFGPDFSSDGSRILYYNSATQASPAGIYAVAATGGAPPAFLHPGSGYCCQRWLRQSSYSNAFAFLKVYGLNGQTFYDIWVVLLDANNQVISDGPVLSTASQAFKAIEDFDTSRTRDALLITADYPTTNRVVDFDLHTSTITDLAGPTFRVHYSADDSQIISTDLPHLRSKEYVTSLQLGTGIITRLTTAGTYGAVDARP